MRTVKKTICAFISAAILAACFFALPNMPWQGAEARMVTAEADVQTIAATANFFTPDNTEEKPENQSGEPVKKEFLKWVELNASEFALNECLKYDIKYHNTEVDFHFVPALSYLSIKNGNNFREATDRKNLTVLLDRLNKGEKMAEILPDNKYTKYYLEAYGAIFETYIGDYTDSSTGQSGYGLRCYFPLAAGHWYNHYDDFGSSRSFGYKRRHLGHDLMGSVGAPIVAVESGTVTECGWNRFGGWRIGIRSFDSKRYYYYAHLRKDRPYAFNLKTGDTVNAGQVIGYLGRTGYSSKENTNLKTGETHLHFGLQLIFDPSQEKGNHEIWVDCYALTKFLSQQRVKAVRDETGESKAVSFREWK